MNLKPHKFCVCLLLSGCCSCPIPSPRQPLAVGTGREGPRIRSAYNLGHADIVIRAPTIEYVLYPETAFPSACPDNLDFAGQGETAPAAVRESVSITPNQGSIEPASIRRSWHKFYDRLSPMSVRDWSIIDSTTPPYDLEARTTTSRFQSSP